MKVATADSTVHRRFTCNEFEALNKIIRSATCTFFDKNSSGTMNPFFLTLSLNNLRTAQ